VILTLPGIAEGRQDIIKLLVSIDVSRTAAYPLIASVPGECW
jgi:hypothetical protein